MDERIASIKAFAINFWNKHLAIFDEMSTTRWIRMLAVLGAYLLLRPFLVRLGERIQGRQYAAQMEERQKAEEAKRQRPKAKISPNALRGHVIGEVDDAGELVGEKGEAEKKIRKRQKKVTIREDGDGEAVVETEGGKPVDDDELLDHLVDYVEGEDGW